MDIVVNNYKIVDFESGELGYTVQPLTDTTVSYDTSIVWSGSQSLKVAKTGTSTNSFGIDINWTSGYNLGQGRAAFYLYVPKEYEDTIRKMIIEFYDSSNNYIRVSYLDKDSYTNWWGLYDVVPRWKEIIAGTGRYIYYGLDFSDVVGMRVIFYTQNASDTPEVHIDRLILNKRVEILNAVGESFTFHDVVSAVESQGFPFLRRLSDKTFLVRTNVYVDPSCQDITFYVTGITLLVDELAAWTRYDTRTIQIADGATGTLRVGDVITEYSPTNFTNYIQITTGYPWGVPIFSGTSSTLDLRALTITATNEHRIYYSHGSISGMIANAAGVFPRGAYTDRELKRSFWASKGYGLWIQGVVTDGDVLMPSGSYALRLEYNTDGVIKNFRIVGDHAYLTHYTFWISEPAPITRKYYNVLSITPNGEAYGFYYWNPNLTTGHHIRHETGMEINIKILDTHGNPVEGAKVEVYGSWSGKLWEAVTDSNGETGIHETLIKWWDGYVYTSPFSVSEDDLTDERPHTIVVTYRGSKATYPLPIAYSDLPLQYTFAAAIDPKLVLDLREVALILPGGKIVPILRVV